MRITLTLLLALMAGCAQHRENLLETAEYRFQGMDKAELLSCAGAPTSTNSKGDGFEYLRYTDSKPGEAKPVCSVTFTLQDGKVRNFDFKGNLDGYDAASETCYQVVRRCW
ncbi:MAG: hypothetical protein ACKN9T_05975 [Candidatus Methylumidiphilus sp.]